MIGLRAPAKTRALVDAAVDEAIARIVVRARSAGPRSELLAQAIARAASGGKRLRPTLVVEVFRSLGGDPAKTPAVLGVAAAYELLHTAFVVHDDVIDHDDERRGVPNIAGEFRRRGALRGADEDGAALLGTAAAILGGDLLLFEATRLIALADVDAATRDRLVRLLDEAVHVSATGELGDVENAVAALDPSMGELLRVAHDKTAVYSFAAPLCSGAVLAGATDEQLARLHGIGGNLGLAFQLVDDLIGAFGTDAQAGRASGADLREAKQTPLIALARSSTSWDRVAGALALAPTGPVAVQDAQRALDESGARRRMLDVVDDALADARDAASALPSRTADLIEHLACEVEARVP